MWWNNRTQQKRHGVLRDHPSGADSLCNDCNALCCRSFPAVNITPAEYNRLRLIGATRLQFSLIGRHKLLIENGCEFLVMGRCTIYEQRPDVCQRFMCREE